MDRNKRSYSLRIDRTLLQKIRCIADSQCRSTNHESRYGEIPSVSQENM